MRKHVKIFGIGFTLACYAIFSPLAYPSEERRYRVELVIFENPFSKNVHNAEEEGRPDLTEALPFVPLDENKLVLKDIKKRLAKRYPTILHTAWIQTPGSRDNPTKVLLSGGKALSNNQQEVEGILQLYPGKQLLVNTDLALFKEPRDEHELIQSARWQTTTPIIIDEINYIQHRQYGMIIMITPEVTRRVEGTNKLLGFSGRL